MLGNTNEQGANGKTQDSLSTYDVDVINSVARN